jgi:hypothetical protein
MSPEATAAYHSLCHDGNQAWNNIQDCLHVGPSAVAVTHSRVLKLAFEVKHIAALMTSGPELHDTQMTLYLISQWLLLTEQSQLCGTLCLCLLYIAITRVCQPLCTTNSKVLTGYSTLAQSSGVNTSCLSLMIAQQT